jgi:hypothetical protein
MSTNVQILEIEDTQANGLINLQDTQSMIISDQQAFGWKDSSGNFYKTFADSYYDGTWHTIRGISGTLNYIPKFTSATAIGDSHIYENIAGTQVNFAVDLALTSGEALFFGVDAAGGILFYNGSILSLSIPKNFKISGGITEIYDNSLQFANSTTGEASDSGTWLGLTDNIFIINNKEARVDAIFIQGAGYTAITVGSSGAASTLGFYGTSGIVKPTVTGSRESNAALASLCTALANCGLITDSTS